MTSIAWDGRYLVSDTRTVQEHSFKENTSFEPKTLEWLEKKLNTTAWHFSNKFYESIDGQQKIFIPKKKLFYRKEVVRAVAVSGKVDYLSELAALPDGFDLVSPTSFFVDAERKDGMFIVITSERTVYQSNGYADRAQYLFINHFDLSRFCSIGLGSIAELNGRYPVTSAERFVNICCMMNSLQGGQLDVWDSFTNTLRRVELQPYSTAVDYTNDVFRALTRIHEAAEEIVEMAERHREAVDILGGTGTQHYPEMYHLVDGKTVLNPEYKGETKSSVTKAALVEAGYKPPVEKQVQQSERIQRAIDDLAEGNGLSAKQARKRTAAANAAQTTKKPPAKKVAKKTPSK